MKPCLAGGELHLLSYIYLVTNKYSVSLKENFIMQKMLSFYLDRRISIFPLKIVLMIVLSFCANGDDIRIVYWNGSTMVELDRLLDNNSDWNVTDTKIWFKTQAAIPAGETDNNHRWLNVQLPSRPL